MFRTYISKLYLQSYEDEVDFISGIKRTCHNTVYPYKIFPQKELEEIDFAPITIFYGGNGSGKTTLLNIIAQKANIMRHSAFNGSDFFEDYVNGCKIKMSHIPPDSQILTSDDVFNYLLNIRYMNDGINMRRQELFEEYTNRKNADNRFKSMADYENWKENYDAKTQSQSQFVRRRLMKNVDMLSNGESALKYFAEHISDNAVYLLDEPENSLSISLQFELSKFIFESARHFGCQFIISTHSPVILSMKEAKIYDLDDFPVREKKWTELENVRLYFDFFNAHKDEFL